WPSIMTAASRSFTGRGRCVPTLWRATRLSRRAWLSKPPSEPPTIADIHAAAARIAGKAIRTPLLASPLLSQRLGGRIFLKCENLQRTGSFKLRGAYNALAALGDEERRQGVVAVSSGNHAQGVAEAARIFGVASTIVMPADAPTTKRAGVISR